MAKMKSIKELMEQVNQGFEIADYYETGKKDVEYMSQNALSLAELRFGDYNVELTVNGDCRFDYDDDTYRYEDDLTDEVIALLRKGVIEMDNNNWFEFFSDNGESFDVGEIDELPTPLAIKQELIEHIIEQMDSAGDKSDVSICGFKHVSKALEGEPLMSEKEFYTKLEDIFAKEGLFNVVGLMGSEYIQDDYGMTHYGLSYYTLDAKIDSFVQAEFEKLFS